MADEDIKEEIKRRVDIDEVISQYVPLQRAGRRYKARCPFHQERTPSFFVDPASGFWHCFGCGAGGDVFSFLMQIEGISFPEAGERLAQRVGLSWQTKPADKAKTQRRKLLRRAVKLAADCFHDNLHQSGGRQALDYLHQRGFTDEVIERFALGYAANQWDDLLKFLGKRGVDALLAGTPVQQPTGAFPKRFEKATFYFEPEELAQLERVWLELMGQGLKCNKSEIVSLLLRAGLEEHRHNPAQSLLVKGLSGRRRR